MHDGTPHSPVIGTGTPCVGVLLAAGFGRRFMAALAQAGPSEASTDTMSAPPTGKLSACLPDGRTLAQASAQALRAATGCTVAVVRPDTLALHTQLQRAGVTLLVSDEAQGGMGFSLAAAARHLIAHCDAGVRAALIALADMPWISADTYRQVRLAACQHAIVVPVFEGRRGHPVALHRDLWEELAQLKGDAGARTILHRHAVHTVEVSDAGIVRDVDLPSDLEAPDPSVWAGRT